MPLQYLYWLEYFHHFVCLRVRYVLLCLALLISRQQSRKRVRHDLTCSRVIQHIHSGKLVED